MIRDTTFMIELLIRLLGYRVSGVTWVKGTVLFSVTSVKGSSNVLKS